MNAMSHRLHLHTVQCLMLLYVHRDCTDYYYKYNTSNSSIRDREPRTSTSAFTQLLSSEFILGLGLGAHF